MRAREYLEQVRRQRFTVQGKRMDLAEARETRDLLKATRNDGLPHGSANADQVQRWLERYEELADTYTGELMRWTAMREQAVRMLDRAREVLMDGDAHAIDLTSIEVVHRYYMQGMGRREIADMFGLSMARVDERKREALDWLDYARGRDGMPLVPIASE